MTEPTTCTVPVEFLRGVIALCTQRGYSPENIEAWSKDDKWVADLWRQAEAALATPQPTQTQAGAVPLTCEWTHNDDDGFWETACGEAWRFDDGGPAENSMKFCHSCGNSLRIKGGQHGTE